MAIERRFCMELVREVFRMKWEEKLSSKFSIRGKVAKCGS